MASSTSSASEVGATVLLISGCQDDQLSRDGFKNGAFTGKLLSVWDEGAWKGGYPAFHEAIRSADAGRPAAELQPGGRRRPRLREGRTPSPSDAPRQRGGPVPRKAMRDVVVCIPGITGSVLRKDGRDVWNISGGALI